MGCKEGGIGEKNSPGLERASGSFFLPGPVFLFPKPLAEEGMPRHAGISGGTTTVDGVARRCGIRPSHNSGDKERALPFRGILAWEWSRR